MKLSKKFFAWGGLFALVAVCVALLPDVAMAQTLGTNCDTSITGTGAVSLFNDVKNLITGPFGATIGLVISLFGAYTWLVGQSNWGLVILAGGALLTVFPQVYVNLLDGLCKALPGTVGTAATPSGQ